ncbi:SDR family oxidoreductase [Mycobacterium yunnanensis]|uniref:3-oxoacyl-[acyl-carrier-protein] reductase MabA n=1 Tax=Mycobacterium yunnanensis TaxID=368477 RepID=A0A9X2Z7E9_9MYCO|nr:SDR family oxidoreductase [Mycobacterium yunnanensis]MCV7424495.1 SDR family oxidoreductase [Mycobacterium yunnanensis]
MDLELRGRAAIVCGSSSGIGLAIARRLTAEGADVIMTARRRDVLQQRASELGAVAHVADLTDADAVDGVVHTAVAEFGRLDVVVWNTGGPAPEAAKDISEGSVLAGVDSLVLPLIRLVRASLPHLRSSGAGRILAVTATGVKEPMPNLGVSSMVRNASTAYLKSLSRDVGRDGITVNCLAPGYIQTGRVEQVFPGGLPPEVLDGVPAGRVGTPDEIADVAAFLVSPRASYVSGVTLNVDGGMARYLY